MDVSVNGMVSLIKKINVLFGLSLRTARVRFWDGISINLQNVIFYSVEK